MRKILSVVLIFTTVLAFSGCGKKLDGGQPDAETVSNGGIAVGQGDWTYFICGSMPEISTDALANTLRGRICRMKAGTDGTEFDVVSDNKAFSMHIYNDRIFYTTPSIKTVMFGYTDIYGSSFKKLYSFKDTEFISYGSKGAAMEDEGNIVYFDYETLQKIKYEIGKDISGISVSENYIYYYSENEKGTNRINISSGTIETMCDENGMFLYSDDTLCYFVCARIPYKLNANTLELTKISESLYKELILNLKNDAIICSASRDEDPGLYMQPLSNIAGAEIGEGGNKARIKIHTKAVSSFCLDDDHIFFVEAETGDVYSMTYDGKEKTVLGNMVSVFNIDSMDVVGNNLYIYDSVESGYVYTVLTDGTGELKAIKG